MMNYFIVLLAALSLGADYLFWRPRLKGLCVWQRRLLCGLLPLLALLPLLPLLEWQLRTDNIAEQMIFPGSRMLLIFLYALLRLVLYAGWLSRKRLLRLLAVGVVILLAALLSYSVVVGRTALRVERLTLQSDRLPAGWEGVRLLHFTDLHIGTLKHPVAECRRLVDTILLLQPDMILFTGDLTNIRHTELDEEVMRELARLQAPLGVYSVTGNHDVGVYIKDSLSLPREQNLRCVVNKQRAMGWSLLEEESRYLVRRGDTITLTGIGFEPSLRNLRHARQLPEDYDPWGLYDNLPKRFFNLTICHLPQLWDGILAHGYGDLTLAGHVHSMQHKLPIGRRGWSLSALFYRRWSGLYEEQGRALYINDGIGSVGIPARLGAEPELTLITLQRAGRQETEAKEPAKI